MAGLSTLTDPADALPPLGEIVPDTRTFRPGPAARTVVAVYGTCLLLALAYPQALAAWLDDLEPNPVVAAAQGCAARLVAVSERLGLAGLSGSLREAGKAITRKPE